MLLGAVDGALLTHLCLPQGLLLTGKTGSQEMRRPPALRDPDCHTECWQLP